MSSVISFQSTPPRRGRPLDRLRRLAVWCFNPRPRAGGDRSRPRRDRAGPRFNPRPRAGGDLTVTAMGCLLSCFNPRPRAGGDLTASLRRCSAEMFQSTPPRRGRLSPSKRFSNNGKPRCSREPMRESRVSGAAVSARYGQPLAGVTEIGPANLPATARTLVVRTGDQTTSGPSRSRAAFAPTCSTRRLQLAPR